MAARGYYNYDPENYHGPLHFYALYASTRLFGRNLLALRLPALLASLACVAAALLFYRHLGRGAALLGSFALAVSPAFVFYGRYSIHESWQVLFLMLGTLAVFQIMSGPPGRRGPWRLLGLSLAGLAATKETWVIHAASALIAAGFLKTAGALAPSLRWRLARRPAPGAAARSSSWRGPLAALLWFLVPWALLYSGFLADPDGLPGFFQAYAFWSKTGFEQGGGHNKSPWYWLSLMARYEWISLAGLAACWLCWLPGSARSRWLALTAAGVFLAYSIIPYKTPWCLISILWPLPFLAGLTAVRLPGRLRTAALALCGLAAAAGLWPCVRLNFLNHSNPREPYVYVQTSPEISRLTGPLLRLARQDPRNNGLTGAVMLDGPFPLPWLLGDFYKTGYYGDGERPPRFDKDFLVAEKADAAEIEKNLRGGYFRETFRLRDGRAPVVAWFRAEVFRPVFEGREPEVGAGKEAQP